jgi:tetratricopeptide (TPR) repeat protein
MRKGLSRYDSKARVDFVLFIPSELHSMAFGASGRSQSGQIKTGIAAAAAPAMVLSEIEQFRMRGDMAAAERLARELVAAQPKSPIALNVLALLLRARGELAEASDLLHRAITEAPNEPALRNNLGNIVMAQDDAVGAEAAYRKALSLKPDYPEACHNLGIALRALGRRDEALAAQRRAVSLKPDYALALVQVGALLIEQGRFQEALEPLDQAVRQAYGLYDVHYYRGMALSNLERFDEAIAALRTAVDIAPDRPEARYVIAKCFAYAGREEDALLAYQTVFDKKPDFLPALHDFSALAWTMGNGDRSLISFQLAREKTGETPDLLLAEANLRLRFTDEVAEPAEGLLRRARQMAPERADVANALARALAQKHRFDEAFPLFQAAVAAAPASVRHRQDFAEALLGVREFAEARRVLEEALARDPHDQITLGGLSLAWRALGDSRYDTLVNHDRFVREYEIAPPPGFSDVASFNRALAGELERLHTRHAPPIDQTLRNGTQTPGTLFKQKSPAIEAVREQIRIAVADYIASLPDDASHPLLARKDKDFVFSGSWSCRLRSSGYHTNHVHNEGWISSAYYVALPQAITQGGQGNLAFGESRFRLGEHDRPQRIVKPAVGKLVLFPSYYWHGTVPFESRDGMRLALAFDVIPGTVEPNRIVLANA